MDRVPASSPTGRPAPDAVPNSPDAPEALGALWRSLAADSDDALVLLRPDEAGTWRSLWANDAFLRLLAVDSRDVLGRPVERMGPPLAPGPAGTSDRPGSPDPEDWRVVVAGADTGGCTGVAATLTGLDASVIPVRVTARDTPGSAGDGPARLVRLTLAPAAALAAAQAAAAAAEYRFRALSDQAPVGIFVSEGGLRLGYVNARMAELTGTSRAGLLGIEWMGCLHPGDLPELIEALQRVLEGTAEELTVRLQSVPGVARWAQLRVSPVQTPERGAGFIGTLEDVTARRAVEHQLAYQASHDALTGLANRRRLLDELTQLLTSRRARDSCALLYVDLDGFKTVNDMFGHEAGDRLLIAVAERLSGSARDGDVVGRLAGDEFVLILRGIEAPADAAAAATRHLAALDAPLHLSGRDVSVSASIGVALPGMCGPGPLTPAAMLRAADRAMYVAKAAGRGCYALAAPGTSPVGAGPGSPGHGSAEGSA